MRCPEQLIHCRKHILEPGVACRVSRLFYLLTCYVMCSRPNGPVDEWSGDEGCGVQFFSQQGACRLLPSVGIHLPKDMKFPEQLVELQNLMKAKDPRALKVGCDRAAS